jgi:hypothetical protein
MPLWGSQSNTAHAPKNKNIVAGTGKTGANLYANSTVDAFVPNLVAGVFTINAAMSNTALYNQLPGWVLVRHGTGPIATISVEKGSGFANGETFRVSGGGVNATANVTTNATSNLASATVVGGGSGFSNSVGLTVTFHREKHLNDIVVGGTPTGYANDDVIRASNGTINATATIVTNATGGFETGNVTITNVGLWANTKANADVAFVVLAANGANSAGSGATFTANLSTSTGGNVTAYTFGGRANRVHYETLVAMRSISGNASVTLPTK